MKKILPILIAILLTTAAHAELLSVTFGAAVDLSASYGGSDVTSNTTQSGTIAAPVITITGLDIDGVGVDDDQIDVVFAVSATGGTLSRLSVGYLLNAGYALTFDIASATVTLGPGATELGLINALGFVSTSGNVTAGTYDVASTDLGFTPMAGQTSTTALPELSNFTMTSTYTENNRAKWIIAEFDVGGEPVIIDPTPPVANDDTYEVEEDTLFTNAAPGVLSNDTDTNGDALTAIQLTSPTNGTLLSFSTNGAFVYQPGSGFTGTDVFTYTATDGGLTSGVATVRFDVSGTPVTLPNIFQSNMVLQRNRPITVWGWGPAGKTVSVSLSSGQSDTAVVDAEGHWELSLASMAATNGPLTLLVTAPGSSVTLTNLAIGDVWFCSGQSNAGWSLSATDGGTEEIAAANYPNFRLIRVPRYKRDDPSDDPIVLEDTLDWDVEEGVMNDKAGTWFVCSPDTAGYFGAVFYYTGKEVHLNLGIPVGIIQSAYAGTPVEAWSKSVLPEAHPIGSDPADPHQLYNGMVYPYLKLPIIGACWYQGERNHDDGGHIYADKLSIMVDDWRTGWAQGNFPFYYIQIPPVFEWNTEADADPMLPYFWEAQTLVMDLSTNTYMVVSSDTTSGGLHPKNKRPLGERTGRRVLKNTYGFSALQDSGPIFSHSIVEGSHLRLHFDEIGSGLAINPDIGYNANGDLALDIYEDLNDNGVLDDGEDVDKDGVLDKWGEDLNHNGVLDADEDIDGDGILDASEYDINFPYLTWFEICGTDGVFTNATATIDGDTVVLSSPAVPNPIGFRYAWSRFAIGNLMNAEGEPARLCRLTPPIARSESYDVGMDGKLHVDPAGILANDQIASSLLPIQRPLMTSEPSNGILMLRSDGSLIYEPNTGFTGTDSFTYVASDGAETSPETTVSINVIPASPETGEITREVWTDVAGFTTDDLVASPDYPDNPSEVGTLSRFDAPRDWGNTFGERIHGYIHPPTNGNYTFWISSAARSKLYLSTDDDPANAILICECPVSLSGDPENWTANASQQSAPQALLAGQRYYIMALHKDSASSDHLSVAWDLAQPGIPNIIEGIYLSGIPAEMPVTTNYTDWSSWYGVSGDGYLLDFAFNLDPTLGDYPTLVPIIGTAGLPFWEVLEIDGLTVEYLRRKDAPGTTYSVQFTDNLQSNWIDSAATELVTPVNGTWERVIVEDVEDIAITSNRFGRVIVIQD